MTIWIDAQLSPVIAKWISQTFGLTAIAVRDLGLRDAKDLVIFTAAKQASVVVMDKGQRFLTPARSIGATSTGHLDYVRQYFE